VFGVGVGELLASWITPSGGPFAVVGSAAIDLAPPWAKDAAIALFGTGDKAALLTLIAIVVLALAAAAGLLEARRPPWGQAVLYILGAVAAIAAMTRAGAGLLDWLPAVASGLLSGLTLRVLARRADASADDGMDEDAGANGTASAREPRDSTRPAPRSAASRRAFLGWAGGAAAIGALALVAGNALRAGSRSVAAVRDALHLPAPATTAPPVPASAELGIQGLAPVITPNASFYRIDTALAVPQVDPSTWTLRIHGLVDREVVLTWDELLAKPLRESFTTLTCVSNEVGGSLIGTAKWLGLPIRELLAEAGPQPDADMVLSRSVDGFSAGTPLEALTDERNAILAVGMNDAPLPLEHGFPARLVVPGLYGYVSATKWVSELEVTRFDRASGYWTPRGWSAHGPIKLESRIDVPRDRHTIAAGDAVIAGVAWQQHVGVAAVEVSIDDGPWQRAELATAISADTWVQWRLPWTAEAGSHRIRCRAVNANGEVQTETHAPPAPDGATGWPEISVQVS